MYKILFLDRDGVVNIDYGHVYQQEKFIFMDGIFDLCQYYKQKGYLIIIITNQAGIAKGLYSLEDFYRLNEWMIEEFKKRKIEITDLFYCYHHPNELCSCRKPQPGLFIEAIKKYPCDINNSLMIGDKTSDLIAAHLVGIKNLYFLEGKYEKEAVDFSYKIIKKLLDLKGKN